MGNLHYVLDILDTGSYLLFLFSGHPPVEL